MPIATPAQSARAAQAEAKAVADAAKAPDVEKLRTLYAAIQAVPLPELTTEAGIAAGVVIAAAIKAVLLTITREAKKL